MIPPDDCKDQHEDTVMNDPPQSWEPIATELAQCSDDDQVAALMERILAKEHASTPGASRGGQVSPPWVLIGYDTRPSAPMLLEAAKAGIAVMGLTVMDAGVVMGSA